MSAGSHALPDCDPPPANPRGADRMLPPGTCDTHLHVFGPQSLYPLDPRRNYTPHECSLADYHRVMRAVGIARAVLVQPSVYGTDNSAMLDGLREAGLAFRGVAVLAPDVTDDELAEMHHLGVRGVRLNLVNPAMVSLEDTLSILRRVTAFGWHLQVQLDLARDPKSLHELLDQVDVPVVVDHFGKLRPETRNHPLMDALKTGRCWVKLSAPYRVSAVAQPHQDLLPLVRALADAHPARLLWGSDWPHTELHAGTPEAAALASLVHDWFPDAALRAQVCAGNPAHLYGYPAGDY